MTPGRSASTLATTLILVLVVAALYFGADIFIPLALAVLISFGLSPAVSRLVRLGLGRTVAVALVVLIAVGAVGGFAAVVSQQMLVLAESLPRYEANVRAKIRAVARAASEGNTFEGIEQLGRTVQEELERATGTQTPASGRGTLAGKAGAPTAPVPVELHEPASRPLDVLADAAGMVLKPLATAVIIIVFVVFFLINREDLRDRFIRLVGTGDMHLTTVAMTDAAQRISRYLVIKFSITTFYGVATGLGLWAIGVPHPLLWGVFGGVIRLVPFIGPVLGAVVPTVWATVFDPGWQMLALSAGLYITIELLINYVLDPFFYGKGTGLSPVAVLAAAIFWTVLWGPIGVLLSLPLTVCLVVIGRHVPNLGFFNVMLGNEPVFSPNLRLYQRLLADDQDEALEIAQDFVEVNGGPQLWDGLIIPVLADIDRDRQRGTLPIERWRRLCRRAQRIGNRALAMATAGAAATPATGRPPGSAPLVLTVGARNLIDATCASIVAQALRSSGCNAAAAPRAMSASDPLAGVARDDVVLCVVCSVDATAMRQLRRAETAVAAAFGRPMPVVALAWGRTPPEAGEPQSEECLVGSVADVVARVTARLEEIACGQPGGAAADVSTAAPPAPGNEEPPCVVSVGVAAG
jgi:predicted PurR-regulated permease PerM